MEFLKRENLYWALKYYIRSSRAISLFLMVLASLMSIAIFSSSIMKFPNGDLVDKPSFVNVPSIFDSLLMRLKLVSSPWRNMDNKIISYIDKNTPINSKIGTLIMAPYGYNRPFAQLLPLAQSEIDLMMPPEKILEELSKYGVSYLHLTNSPGLVPGVALAIEPWLTNINLIPRLENVHLLEHIDYGNGIQESLYKLN